MFLDGKYVYLDSSILYWLYIQRRNNYIWEAETAQWVKCFLWQREYMSAFPCNHIQDVHGCACLWPQWWGDRDRRIPGECYPASLAEISKLEVYWETVTQKDSEIHRRRHPSPVSGPYAHVFVHTLINVCKSMCVDKCTRVHSQAYIKHIGRCVHACTEHTFHIHTCLV